MRPVRARIHNLSPDKADNGGLSRFTVSLKFGQHLPGCQEGSRLGNIPTRTL
jgi:hypothetical protein